MKWRPDMSMSRRRQYNDYMRKNYLRREIQRYLKGERERVPQPIKPANWLRDLYRKWRVAPLVVLPTDEMTQEDIDKAKQLHKVIRETVKDLLPADATKHEVDMTIVIHGERLAAYILDNDLLT